MRLWFADEGVVDMDLEQLGFISTDNFDWAAAIESRVEEIRSEVMAFVGGRQVEPYFDEGLATNRRGWRTLGFIFWGVPFKKKIREGHVIMASFKSIPHLLSCSISVLEPGTAIKPHRGDTNAIYRAHFPIVVPATLPNCGLRVGKEEVSWEYGKFLIFEDANCHESWNYSSEARVVVIIDVIKPEFIMYKREICSRVWARLILNGALARLGFRLPSFIYKKCIIVLSWSFGLYFRVFPPVFNG